MRSVTLPKIDACFASGMKFVFGKVKSVLQVSSMQNEKHCEAVKDCDDCNTLQLAIRYKLQLAIRYISKKSFPLGSIKAGANPDLSPCRGFNLIFQRASPPLSQWNSLASPQKLSKTH